MKSETSLPAKPITFLKSIHTSQLHFSIIQFEKVSTNFSRIQWFRFILCWTFVEWTKCTQTQHADCRQLHWDVRQQNPGNDNIIMHCIAWATNCYTRLWSEWTNNAIWIWTAATENPSMLERSEPSAQSIQNTGKNFGSKRYSRRTWRELQPPITGAVGTVTDIEAPDIPQHNWRIRDTTYDVGWKYILLRW